MPCEAYRSKRAIPSQIRRLDALPLAFVLSLNLHNWHHLPFKRPPLPHPRPRHIRYSLLYHIVGIQVDKIPHRHHFPTLVADRPRPGVEDVIVGDRRVELCVDLRPEHVADQDALFHRRGPREGENEVLVLVLVVGRVVFWVEAREGAEGDGQ
jgi:hypothetical protein